MEYLEIQDKLRTIVLTVPKHHLVQQLTMAVVDMLKASNAEAARLRATADGLFAMVDSQAKDIESLKAVAEVASNEIAECDRIWSEQEKLIAELRAQLAAIRATDNGTFQPERICWACECRRPDDDSDCVHCGADRERY